MSGGYLLEARRAMEARPDATDAQWAAFAEAVRERAPELCEMLGVEQ